jgi:hypothetical protein
MRGDHRELETILVITPVISRSRCILKRLIKLMVAVIGSGPAPVASIAFNLLIGAALARAALDGLDVVVILSAYLILTGLSRFVEEGMRGEPQTPVWRGLSLYQWLCVGLVSAGMPVTFLPGAGALSGPALPGLGGVAIAASISMLWVVGLSVDWPWTGWRFSRLAPLDG